MPLVLKVGTATPSRGMELPDGSQLLVTNSLKARSAKIILAHLSFDTVASGTTP